MKILFAFLVTLISYLPLLAQCQEETKLITTLYYEFNKTSASEDQLAKLDDVIKLLESDTSIKIEIDGYCDATGSNYINDRISFARAKGVADYLLARNISEEQITYQGFGVDSAAESHAQARRVEVIQIITIAIEETPAPKPTKEPKQKHHDESPKTTEERPVAEIPNISEQIANSPKIDIGLRANLLYWLVGLMNLGVEWHPNNTQLGVVLNGGYSFLGDTTWNHNLGGWFISPELRYYLTSNKQWFVGAQFICGGYNYKLSDTGYQGNVIGGGIMGGHKITLNDNFDMDFTLGVGYGKLSYDTYYHDKATKTNPYIGKSLSKSSIIPIQAGVNLIWKIN